MRYTYPDYYSEFSCIGNKCSDTCCAGWMVDIDDETAQVYKSMPLPIGKKLREKLRGESGGYYFELDKKKRCPFLNKDNLCDIILALGEGGLSVTCTEYPRFYADTPIYEQVDLTLSCPEAARIFFSKKGSIKYITEDIKEDNEEDDGLFGEDPFGHGKNPKNDRQFKAEIEESGMDKNELKCLLKLFSVREKCFDIIQYNKENVTDLWKNIMLLILNEYEENMPDYEDFIDITSDYEDESILSNIKTMEVVNPLWKKYMDSINQNKKEVSLNIKNLLLKDLHYKDSSDDFPFKGVKDDFTFKGSKDDFTFKGSKDDSTFEGSKDDSFLNCSLERFISYLLFRYLIDIFYHKSVKRTLSFIRRCLRILLLLLGESVLFKEDKVVDMSIMEERARIFSRQIEHSDRNVEILLK